MNSTELAAFGLLVAIALGAAAYFRKHQLATRVRIAMSCLAVGLLSFRLIRDNGFNAGSMVLIGVAVLVLGSALWYLRQTERHVSSADDEGEL